MASKKKRNTVAELVAAVEKLREFGLPDDALERCVRDAEDGLEVGLGDVPPAVPAKCRLGAVARAELMRSLSTLVRVIRERSDASRARASKVRTELGNSTRQLG